MSLLQPADISSYLSEPSVPEREMLKIFKTDDALTIFDIGSCEGEDSIRYTRRFPQATVHAFEPLPSNQAIVRENFARYGVTRATLAPVALSNSSGEATFHVSSGHPQNEFAGKDWNYGNKSSSLLAPASGEPMHGWIEFKQAITVRTETLDNYCAERGITHIDFIHMDVQGAESLVLKGAARMLPHISAIWLEVSSKELYRGQALDADIRKLMSDHGFMLAHSIYQNDGVEGDHLYVNRRERRVWFYGITRPLRTLLGRLKRAVS